MTLMYDIMILWIGRCCVGSYYRSGTVNSKTFNSRFFLIRTNFLFNCLPDSYYFMFKMYSYFEFHLIRIKNLVDKWLQIHCFCYLLTRFYFKLSEIWIYCIFQNWDGIEIWTRRKRMHEWTTPNQTVFLADTGPSLEY